MAVAEIAKAVSIKQERVSDSEGGGGSDIGATLEPVDLEDRIVHLCDANPEGLTADMINNDRKVSNEQLMQALQRLLSQGKIEMFKLGSQIIYKLNASVSTSSTKSFENEEKLVYQIIESSGNKGIWIRDIRCNSNLSATTIRKILKTLESKKFIKSIKSVAASKKKVYMLYDLEPHEEITGGAWYSEQQEFETEYVDVLNAQCLRFLHQKSLKVIQSESYSSLPHHRWMSSAATVEEVTNYISDIKISKDKLTSGNIEAILNTLVYDGKVEVIHQSNGTKCYRYVTSLNFVNGITRVPCGICPVIDQCVIGGAVSPSTCIYMSDWINF